LEEEDAGERETPRRWGTFGPIWPRKTSPGRGESLQEGRRKKEKKRKGGLRKKSSCKLSIRMCWGTEKRGRENSSVALEQAGMSSPRSRRVKKKIRNSRSTGTIKRDLAPKSRGKMPRRTPSSAEREASSLDYKKGQGGKRRSGSALREYCNSKGERRGKGRLRLEKGVFEVTRGSSILGDIKKKN